MPKSDILSRKLNYAPLDHKGVELSKNLPSPSISSNTTSNKSSASSSTLGKSSLASPAPSAHKAPSIAVQGGSSMASSSSKASTKTSKSAAGRGQQFELSHLLEADFEYKGYHKFRRILGRGSFGTVVECERKSDNKLIAMKLCTRKAIHRWMSLDQLIDDVDERLVEHSSFFASLLSSALSDEELLVPSEVACLVRASKLNGVVKIVDYIPAASVPSRKSRSSGTSSSSSSSSERDHDDEHEYALKQAQDNDNNNNNDDDDDDCDSECCESVVGIALERHANETCLFDYLLERDEGVVGESEARLIMRQVVETSLDLLQLGIYHGDIKSENILIEPKTGFVRLIDFGSAHLLVDAVVSAKASSSPSSPNDHRHHHHHHAQHHHNHHQQLHHNQHHHQQPHHHHQDQAHPSMCSRQSLSPSSSFVAHAAAANKPVRTFRGTNLYKPPEFLLHHCFYPRPSTVWTCGILLYNMVCGRFPFDTDTDVLTHQEHDVVFTRYDERRLSAPIKDLIRRCLAFFVCDRIVIEKVLTHPWVTPSSSSSSQTSTSKTTPASASSSSSSTTTTATNKSRFS